MRTGSLKYLLLLILLSILFLANYSYAGTTDDNNLSQTDSLRQQLSLSLPDSVRIEILYRLSWLLSERNAHVALSYAQEGLQLYGPKEDIRTVNFFYRIGNIYQRMPDYPKALTFHFKGLRLAEALNDKEKISVILKNIGTCYLGLKHYALADKYYRQSLKTAIENNLKTEAIYLNMGVAAAVTEHFTESIFYYQKALEACKDNNRNLKAILYNNIGSSYVDLNNTKLAEDYCMKALQTVDTNNIYTLIGIYGSLGELYSHKKDFVRAGKYLLMAKQKALLSGLNVSDVSVYEAIITVYEKQKDYKNAYLNLRELQAVNDSIYKETFTRQINEMQAKYESDKKDKELLLAKAATEKEQLAKNIAIAGFILMLLTGGVIARNVVLKQRVKNKILKEQNMLAEHDIMKLLQENTEAKYEILKSKTNPHFLFNSLNVLSSIIADNPEQAQEYVERFSTFYRTILKTGNQALISLHDEMGIVQNYLYLQKMRFEDNLISNVHISPDQQRVFVPPLAVQMLVENAIKHNTITGSRNLHIDIYADADFIFIKNNLQKKHETILSTSTGHKSILGRYALITDVKPLFTETETTYTAQLPLLKSKDKAQYRLKEEAIV